MFAKKEPMFLVKYQVKLIPTGYESKKKKLTKPQLEALQNDSSVRILEVVEK